ncbi:a84cfdd7-417d-4aa4-948b-bef6a173df52 [Sclerotinia trifoliorum]|uniref:A84cfdd7-417d-4aa4-948b-bef6a173df52 n=1 Tax=Sclerotinia trifoliorum TaxID=28548 RepID=A0A8H2VLX5_9HELO|nr:a84cfdd7-417d-4aa4-948b-bef6a173df52 [Sclerotinia trifoliorum]
MPVQCLSMASMDLKTIEIYIKAKIMSATGCSNFPNDCGPLSVDIEIEGVGVYISFIATALWTLSAAVLRVPCQLALHSHQYAEQAELEYHDFDHKSDKGTAARLYHLGKERVRFYRRGILPLPSKKPNVPRWKLLNAALTPLILSLADQQLVISSAVMIAGLYNFDTISAYYYNIIVYLAWFSSFTHSVALLSMSDYFLQNRILGGVRFCGYIGNLLLFIAAQSRARSFGNTSGLFRSFNSEKINGEAAACLAKCATAVPYTGYEHSLRIAIITLLFFQALLKCIPQRIRNDFSLWLYGRCLKIFRITNRERLCLWLAFVFQGFIASFWVLPILVIIITLIFGINHALIMRDKSRYPGLEITEDFITQQNSWTFGQFVACILLILPLISALEGSLNEREKLRNENQAASLPSHNSQWRHRINMLLKFTHLGKPPSTNNQGLRSRITSWADNNSVDHPFCSEKERSSPHPMSSVQDSRLPQPRERQMSQPFPLRLFTSESGEPILLPCSKNTSPGLEIVKKS